jgi:steroid delta-isomerase-like uncharacterized protein
MATSIDVHREAHDAFNRNDAAGMRAILGADVVGVDHATGRTMEGPDAFIAWLDEWKTGMSDATVAEPDYLDAGAWSVCRFTGRGTNDGPMGPANATGRSIELAFCELAETRDGRIVRQEIYYDALGLLAQLGVVEAPAPA